MFDHYTHKQLANRLRVSVKGLLRLITHGLVPFPKDAGESEEAVFPFRMIHDWENGQFYRSWRPSKGEKVYYIRKGYYREDCVWVPPELQLGEFSSLRVTTSGADAFAKDDRGEQTYIGDANYIFPCNKDGLISASGTYVFVLKKFMERVS